YPRCNGRRPMPLHCLRSIAIGVPNVDAVRAFYRDFGLDEIAPGRFASADGGEQLRIESAARRSLLALCVGVDDADDLARAAASLARFDVEAERSRRAWRASEPISGVRVELAIGPRAAQKPAPPLETNGPGRSVRVDARSRAAQGRAAGRPRRL